MKTISPLSAQTKYGAISPGSSVIFHPLSGLVYSRYKVRPDSLPGRDYPYLGRSLATFATLVTDGPIILKFGSGLNKGTRTTSPHLRRFVAAITLVANGLAIL